MDLRATKLGVAFSRLQFDMDEVRQTSLEVRRSHWQWSGWASVSMVVCGCFFLVVLAELEFDVLYMFFFFWQNCLLYWNVLDKYEKK